MPPAITIVDEDIDLIETLSSKGFSLRAIARRLGMSRTTLEKKIEDDPAIAEALARGRESEEHDLVGALYARAMDLSNAQGAASAMFLLKTRHHYRELGDVDTGPRVGIVVQLPKALDPAQYERLIQVYGIETSTEGKRDDN